MSIHREQHLLDSPSLRSVLREVTIAHLTFKPIQRADDIHAPFCWRKEQHETAATRSRNLARERASVKRCGIDIVDFRVGN